MNRNFFLLIFLMVLSLTASAQTIKKLNAQDFDKKLIEKKGATLIDVRTPEEFAQEHLTNAISIDYYSSDFKAKAAKLDKTKPVFVYCKAGSRSNAAANILTELGFKEIYDLSGGITAWQQSNKPVVK
jgi:rhodanese-related sulfurtransferase